MSYFKLARAVGSTARNGINVVRLQRNGIDPIAHPQGRQAFKEWAQELCRIFETRIHIFGEPIETTAGLFVGNHASYLDIPVICSLEPVSFVAKAEMQKWPIFGKVGDALGIIWHNRKDGNSRKSTAENIKLAVQEGKRVCVFPEGTTSLRGLPWRTGVFNVAHEVGASLQPFSIYYRPAHLAAFEDPSMLKHSLALNSEGHLDVYLTVGPSITVKDPVKDCQEWERWNKSILHKALESQGL